MRDPKRPRADAAGQAHPNHGRQPEGPPTPRLDDRSNRLAQWWYANGLRTGDGVAMLDFWRGARQLHNARTPPRRTALVAAVLCGYLLAAADRFAAARFVAARFASVLRVLPRFAFRDALGSGEV